MRKYDSYKDSGVEWIGEIPSHWEVKRGDGFFELKKNLIKKEDLNGLQIYHYSIPSIQEFGKPLLEDGSTINSHKYEVKGNEILFSKLNPRKGTITLSTEHDKLAVASTEFVILKPIVNEIKFCFYFLLSDGFKLYISSLVESATKSHQRANPSDIYKSKILLPPRKEQIAIAAYLDRKTAEIDELISDKKRLLELYEEEKLAIINQAVTKGINPDVPMKDSGIEWLGEIPEHWEVKRLKYVASINDEVLTEKTDEDYEIEYVEISGVKNGIGIVETSTYRFKDAPSRARRIVRDGDVLVSTVRTYLKSIAKVESPPYNLIASTGFAVIRSRKINSDYAGYLFYSEPLIGEIISLSTGVSYPAMNSSQIGDIYMPIPPLPEQQSIVRHIEAECDRIDTKIANTEKLVDLLTEYRTALISEVVTGKVKVT